VTPRPRRQQIEELDALLEGQLAPADASPASRRLASVATAVVEHDPLPAVELGAERKAALRTQLLADIAALPAPVTERAREAFAPRMRRAANQARVAVASTMAASMVGTTGVAVAAQEALPGDALYGVKKATESLRLSLAGDHVASGRLELRFAEERLEEVIEGSQDQRVPSADDLIGALSEMDGRSLSGAETLILVAERDDRPELLEEVAAFTDRQASALAAAYGSFPVAVKPHAEDSLSVLRRIRMELLIPAIERCDCVELAGSSSPLSSGDEAGTDGAWFRSSSLPLPPADTRSEGGPFGTAHETPPPTTEQGLDVEEATGTSTSPAPAVSDSVRDTGSTLEDGVGATADTTQQVVEGTSRTVDKVTGDTAGTAGKVADGDVGGAADDAGNDAVGTSNKLVDEVVDTTKKAAEDIGTIDDLLGP
jgi:hypothetical protein